MNKQKVKVKLKEKLNRLIQFFYSRLFIVFFLISIQVLVFSLIVWEIAETEKWISLALSLLSIIIIVYVLKKDEVVEYKLIWIMFVGLLPQLGGALYLLIGNKKPSRRMRESLEYVQKIHADEFTTNQKAIDSLAPRQKSTAKYINDCGPFPAHDNTQMKYYSVGEDMFTDLIIDIKNAKKFIFMEFFIVSEGYMWRTIFELLKEKANSGIDVRVMFDDMGSAPALPEKLKEDCEKNNIKCTMFNPLIPFVSIVMNNRNHRKIVSIDGDISYNGGVNIADEYINKIDRFGHWKDSAVRLYGDATWNFTVMFLNMWNGINKTDEDYTAFKTSPNLIHDIKDNGVVQPFSDSPLDNEQLGENIYIEMINQAETYAYIFTPYLIIDSQMQNALTLAKKRGVDVRIVTPGIPDKPLIFRLTRSFYKPLLNSDVKIYEYTPGFLHAKSCIVDDEIGVVGSINMDYRSLYLHFECGTLIYNSEIIKHIKKDYLDTVKLSNEITEDFPRSGLVWSLIDAGLRALSPLL